MIYLDYQASAPLAPEARDAMLPWLGDGFANPHSAHSFGRRAAAAVEAARERVAAPFGSGGRLVFTSGATEAANWALWGAMRLSGRAKLVTVATEHACVLDTAAWLETEGIELIVLPVDVDGLVDLTAAAKAIDRDTGLVAAMLVNNEIGIVQPVAALAALAQGAGALFFCDAVQGYGRVPLPSADMIAISAHKVHGPKGVGALWLRDGLVLPPLLHGGGQEAGLRSGTLSPALCAGFGAAAALMDPQAERAHAARLRDRLLDALGEGWTLNGAADPRWPGNLNLRRDGLDAGRLVAELRDVAFSVGSACASGSGRPSHVLAALGLTNAQARASIRLGFGRMTTAHEAARGGEAIRAAALAQAAFA